MSPQLGVILLLLAFLSAIYALIASLISTRKDNPALVESARNATLAIWPLLTFASLLLIGLLIRGVFGVEYVWNVTDLAMPTYLKITALWGGQAGSLLFWSWLMSTFAAGAMLRNWRRERNLMPHFIAASMGTLAFFILLVLFWENPFASFYQSPSGEVQAYLFGPLGALSDLTASYIRFAERLPGLLGVIVGGVKPLAAPRGAFPVNPPNGNGLNPLLRHPGMIIHPPLLYLGFVGFVIPYSFGMAALATGQLSDSWIRSTRRWTLVAWLFLSLGLIMGGWWAYDVLGWGGYWGWDPVENAAFMPWLTGTAFLHSVMIQEKRGMLKRWNMVLIILTYLQVVLGTFATRSGFVSSVHSFAQSAIGPLFFLFLVGAIVISVSLLVRRWEDLAAEHQLDSLLSRETIFLLQNLVFVSLNVAIFIGTYWPVFTELLAEFTPSVERSSVGPGYYERVTAPLFALMLLLMGVAPLIAWKRASLRRLGRALLWPTVLTLVLLGGLFGLGVHRPGVLVGYGLAILVALVTLLEYHRGAMARVRSHGENYLAALRTLFGRNRRRYGGYMIHLGVVIMAIGVIASNVSQLETQQAVAAGQTITLGKYVLEYEGLERFVATDGRSVMRAQTVVYHNGREVARLRPRIDNYPSGQPMSIPGTYTNLLGDDFYVLLVSWEPVGLSSATFKVYYNPLVNWIWGGGFIFMLGTLVAAWPDFGEERSAAPYPGRSRPVPAAGR
ncbi:MAG TPA: heme lyase CcmF/NrfE family subunit [Chloroflexi bacterium]|nr:heme lyase CcmF/NrfE family subunit [Chloroflexota bacterium]